MNRFLSYLCVAFLACACTQALDLNRDGREGAVRLKLSLSEESKALSAQELLESSVVKIYKADFSGLIRRYAYNELPSEIYLPVGEYRMDIEAGEATREKADTASWTNKSYKGSEHFAIEAGKTLELAVTAGVSNVISVVIFDSTVSQFFEEGYTFTIGMDAEDASKMLVYTSAESAREGYFIMYGENPRLYWTFSGKLKKNGEVLTKSGRTAVVKKGTRYSLNPKYTSRDGDLVFDLSVDVKTTDYDDMIVFEPSGSTGLVASEKWEIWAGHATVHAEVDESEFPDPSDIKFDWSPDGLTWKTVDAARDSKGLYSAVIKGLKPSTSYQYRLVLAGEVSGEPLTLTTDSARQLPNWSFETTSNAEGKNYVVFYDPSSSDPELKTKFWDSGSSASAGMLGADYAICYSDSDVPSGTSSKKSARLQSVSISIAGKLAAGNLFTGEFAGTVGTKGGKVNFGRPWNGCRPTAVRFWYKYYGGKVDYGGAKLAEGDYDECSFKVALGNWNHSKYGGSSSCPVQVNTTDKSTFWDFATIDGTVAYADFYEKGNGSLGVWKPVTLQLAYKDEKTMPSFIIVAGAACRYGDYFNGCSSSKLYLDEVELLYE